MHVAHSVQRRKYIPDPDHTRGSERRILRHRQLVGGTCQVTQTGKNKTPLHHRGPKEHCEMLADHYSTGRYSLNVPVFGPAGWFINAWKRLPYEAATIVYTYDNPKPSAAQKT